MGDGEPHGAADAPTVASADEAVDWEAVRRAYELSGESVAAIQRRFGVTPSQLRRRRVGEGWTTRPAVATPGPQQGRKPIGEESLDFRLNRLLTVGLAMLEKRIGEEGMTETNARTLTELARAQEIRMRSMRTHKAAKAREKKNKNAGQHFRDDPAWLLAEINRRLDRLTEEAEPREETYASEKNPRGERAGRA